jgi:hypothetical protein
MKLHINTWEQLKINMEKVAVWWQCRNNISDAYKLSVSVCI